MGYEQADITDRAADGDGQPRQDRRRDIDHQPYPAKIHAEMYCFLFAGKQPTPEVIAQIRVQFGLEKPAWMQYGLFVEHVFIGDR